MPHEDDPLEHERASWKPSPGLAVAVTESAIPALASCQLAPVALRLTDLPRSER